MKKKNYANLSGNAVVKETEMLTLKGGYTLDYGCESNVCAIDRSGAKDLCSDAYCRSGVGPSRPIETIDKCKLFTSL